jgi:hypothetical protein
MEEYSFEVVLNLFIMLMNISRDLMQGYKPGSLKNLAPDL